MEAVKAAVAAAEAAEKATDLNAGLASAINGCKQVHARARTSLEDVSILISRKTKANAKAEARRARVKEKEKTGAAVKPKVTKAEKAKTAAAAKQKETAVAARGVMVTPKAAKTEAVLRTARVTLSHEARHQETARNLHQADPANACIGIETRARMERHARSTTLLHAETGKQVAARKASYAHTGT